ncbi:MAG: alpha/beta hydrolase [Chloroflexi bacterium]|nr:alpha/beta hydrolase [Chloroflexota bacterium]MCI0579004.1 alpha/beta hydrolase [Chloroflexota bacterium]MCI0644791.1 alpha/beta hydrolase [Chloroflexota bacterium]MCI0731966.1 alpha/beta hydrolase [Chloroflexota bacterium]
MNTKSIYKTPAGERAVQALYDSLLARWPVPCEMGTVATRHGHTFVISSGELSAPALVLLHGAATNSAMWRGDIVEYSRRYRVYAIDLPGEPGKSAPNRLAWDSPAYAEWLDDVFDALELDKAIVVGISQGGWTAIKFAAYRPERVEKLVLLAPGGIVPARVSFIVIAIPLSLLGRWGARRLIRWLYGRQPIPVGVEEITTPIISHFKARLGVLPLFSDEELRRLVMPLFLLGGAQDAISDLEAVAARMRKLAPHMVVKILPNAGHVLLNTTGPILSFLAAGELVAI